MYQSSVLSFSPNCQGKNSDYRVDDTHHFLFSNALRGRDTYNWNSVSGQVSGLYYVVSELSRTFTYILRCLLSCRLFKANV